MNPKVEIFSQGEELVSGQIADTNAAWLSRQLIEKGFAVTRHTAVGDKLDDLVLLLREIAARADCCICTGGLGPTVDDLTAEAVAIAFSCPLEFDPIAYQQMAEFFNRRGRSMPESNRKQAMLPAGAIRLDNEWGTAPGFAIKTDHCYFAFVPGVPYEMKQMFKEKIAPIVLTKFNPQPWQLITIKTLGMGESDLQCCLDQLSFPESVQLSFRTGSEENQTKLLFPPEFSVTEVENFTEKVVQQIGEPVFAIDGLGNKAKNIISVLSERLQSQQQTLSILETLSQGLMAAKCIDMDKNILSESWYTNKLQQIESKLGVVMQKDLSIMASEIAQVYRNQTGTDYALVQVYDINAADETHHQQSVQLFQALATPLETLTQVNRVNGSIKRKQNQAALLGLDFLRRYLQNKISSQNLKY